MTPYIKLGPGGDYERDVDPDDFPRWPLILVLLTIIVAVAFALGKGFAHVN